MHLQIDNRMGRAGTHFQEWIKLVTPKLRFGPPAKKDNIFLTGCLSKIQHRVIIIIIIRAFYYIHVVVINNKNKIIS